MTTKQSYAKTVLRICTQRRPPRRHLNLSRTLLIPCVSLLTVSRTLNFLFKVLFIFPSRYLFAIGLVPIFSFRRSLPPFFGLHSQATRLSESTSSTSLYCTHGVLTLSDAPFQATLQYKLCLDSTSLDYNSPIYRLEILSLSCSRFTRRYWGNPC